MSGLRPTALQDDEYRFPYCFDYQEGFRGDDAFLDNWHNGELPPSAAFLYFRYDFTFGIRRHTPLHKAAMGILDAAYSPEESPGFDAGQRADLLPITTGDYPIERVCRVTLAPVENTGIGFIDWTWKSSAGQTKKLYLLGRSG